MWQAFKNCFKIKELRSRILFTFAVIALCRVAASVPCPGIDPENLNRFFDAMRNQASGQLANILDIFTGGALSNFAVAGLGIMPYITASIILQVLTPVTPTLEKWRREGETGMHKYNQTTRYLTLIICIVQGYMFAAAMENPGGLVGLNVDIQVVTNPGIQFRLMTMIILTCGTMILMWLGEQITEKGVGQGASLIITIGIIVSLPSAMFRIYEMFRTPGPNQLTLIHVMILVAIFILVTAFTVALSLAVPFCSPPAPYDALQ